MQGPPVVAPVELRVVGPDLDVLRDLGDRIRNLMADVPEVMQARTQIEGPNWSALAFWLGYAAIVVTVLVSVFL